MRGLIPDSPLPGLSFEAAYDGFVGGSGRSSVVHFETYAGTEHACLGVLPMPDFDDIVMCEVPRRRITGKIFTDAGQELELRREKRL